ncbi:MAG: hypothetical protein AAGE61_10055 [Pseudomonadota bacterium]
MGTLYMDSSEGVSRFFRIAFSVIVSMLVALMLSSFVWSDIEGHFTHRAGGGLFIALFFFPFFAGFTIAMTLVFYWIDSYLHERGPIGTKASILITILLVLLLGVGFINRLYGALALFFLIYWCLTGRVAGRPGWSLKDFKTTAWDEKVYLIVMTVPAYFAVQFAIGVLMHIVPAPLHLPGKPAFQVEHEHFLTTDIKWALIRFPDPQSCLEWGADAKKREDLKRMDWDRIDRTSAATVCTFRLLHKWGGIAEAANWFEAQGLNVSQGGWSSKKPHVNRDGTLEVHAGWHVKTKGPRFPTSGFMARIFAAIPYGMTVEATYTPDGKELLYLRYGYSTL